MLLLLLLLVWAMLAVAVCAVCAAGGAADEGTEKWYTDQQRGKEEAGSEQDAA